MAVFVGATSSVSVLGDYLEVPGLGFLPVNAFVIHADNAQHATTNASPPDPVEHPPA